MRMFKLLATVALVALIAPLTVAQEAEEKTDRKTESTDKPDTSGEDAEGDEFDRGDAEAEKFLKRAYTRVYSAESKGLKKLHADSSIIADLSDMGFGEQPFEGTLTWVSGGKAEWNSAVEAEGEGNTRMDGVSEIAKQLFEPYLAYVTGFGSWDVRFKEASFEFGDPVKDEDDKEVAKTVKVDFSDEDTPDATFAVAENKVVSVTTNEKFRETTADVTHTFEYEDQGTHLRLSGVVAGTEIDMSALPQQQPDPKNPEPKSAQKESLDGKIKVKKYGKVGEFEIAVEFEGELSLMGMKFPVTLTLSDSKINDDVKDEELPGDDEPESDDDEF